ncbi:hypothetical protein DM867_01630 [Halosegnis rubeus]|uniref:Uncharacterized protein n=1 Tax=Halosegnis rubeus TaxID=2212850 RepID=A0A5N5UBX3_9EURY|nr:hypothetical protein [Halosegnis rubeus]KAB7515869.1 hypothetical protein DM867_01630 [Halosegnis rubeus]KAB7516916.1 hypothetical protein DMP03_06015 [Halosegnis rubeus]KAB7519955.1 hypothetical protein DP108_01515 [Halosegnis rubeus]
MTDGHQSTRRALLRVAGVATAAGLAGCTGSPSDGGSGDTGGADTETPTDTETPPPEDAAGRVRLVSSDDNPDLAVEPAVIVVEEFVTADGPAVLRVDVENPTDETVVGEYRDVVFQYVSSSDFSYQLLPHSERSTTGVPERERPPYPTDEDAPCWRLTEPLAQTTEYGTVSIPADGTLTAFVGLYANPDAETCLPTGEHRFEATYGIEEPVGTSSGTATDDAWTTAEWGFSLSVESL